MSTPSIQTDIVNESPERKSDPIVNLITRVRFSFETPTEVFRKIWQVLDAKLTPKVKDLVNLFRQRFDFMPKCKLEFRIDDFEVHYCEDISIMKENDIVQVRIGQWPRDGRMPPTEISSTETSHDRGRSKLSQRKRSRSKTPKRNRLSRSRSTSDSDIALRKLDQWRNRNRNSSRTDSYKKDNKSSSQTYTARDSCVTEREDYLRRERSRERVLTLSH